ncbi:MAG: carboxypeptidase-like regulatory domain-containing protein [Saprospiraceae bacterium]|nr:carboxypeptidase-like regulatory domain-containing protein [Saprospiraceae bacterium]
MRTILTSIFLLFVLHLLAQDSNGLTGSVTPPDATAVAHPGVDAKSISIKVMDMKSREEIPFFTIDFTSCGHPMYQSSEQGTFSLMAEEDFACHTRISKSGYAHLDLLLDYHEISGDKKTYNVFLSRSPNYYHGNMRDNSDRNLYLAEALIEVKADDEGSLQRVMTDKQGQFAIYILPNKEYELTATRAHYKHHKFSFSTGEKVDPSIIKNLYLEPQEGKRPEGLGTEVGVAKKNHLSRIEAISYYSIQVGAKRLPEINLVYYQEALGRYGEVFTDDRYKLVKIKVGKYFDKSVAEAMLEIVRSNKDFSDAFLTKYLPPRQNSVEEASASKVFYKVRLASYLNASLFDAAKVSQLGTVSHFLKDEWTIILLGDYVDLEVARTACATARERGFLSAHIVIQDGNGLKRVQ